MNSSRVTFGKCVAISSQQLTAVRPAVCCEAREEARARRPSTKGAKPLRCGVHPLCASRITFADSLKPFRRWTRRGGHEVVQRPVTAPAAQPGSGGHGAVHEVERVADGLLERTAERQ